VEESVSAGDDCEAEVESGAKREGVLPDERDVDLLQQGLFTNDIYMREVVVESHADPLPLELAESLQPAAHTQRSAEMNAWRKAG
jgi:hypothetical protein